jgi:hypothetical protein
MTEIDITDPEFIMDCILLMKAKEMASALFWEKRNPYVSHFKYSIKLPDLTSVDTELRTLEEMGVDVNLTKLIAFDERGSRLFKRIDSACYYVLFVGY